MTVRVEEHTGPRGELRPLFELAEDSSSELDASIDAGRVLVAVEGDGTVGHLQLTETGSPSALEIKNLAVVPSHRGRGVGRALVDAAVALARREGCARLLVSTAAADTGNLRFYQRLGFRMRSVERDAFTEATGYPPGIEIDGIPLRDRVWFDRDIDRWSPPRAQGGAGGASGGGRPARDIDRRAPRPAAGGPFM